MSEDVVASADDAPFPGVRPMTDTESNLMTQVLDLRRRNGELLAEVEKLRGALSDLVDTDDCWYDHNGDCQAHGFFDGPCGHAVAKELLAGRE